MKMTRDLYSLNMFAKLTVLHRQILFSLAIAAIAEPTKTQISAEHVPYSQRGYIQVVETGHLLLPLAVLANVCTDVVRATGHDLAHFWCLEG